MYQRLERAYLSSNPRPSLHSIAENRELKSLQQRTIPLSKRIFVRQKRFSSPSSKCRQKWVPLCKLHQFPIDRYYLCIDLSHNLSQMLFRTVTDQSIITILALFAAAVAAATFQIREPSPAPIDMQAMINATVSAATKNTNNN